MSLTDAEIEAELEIEDEIMEKGMEELDPFGMEGEEEEKEPDVPNPQNPIAPVQQPSTELSIKMSELLPSSPPPTPTLDSIDSALADTGVEISDDSLGMAAFELFARWITYQEKNSKWALVGAYRLFDLDPDSPTCDVEKVEVMERETKDRCLKLYNRMARHQLIDIHDGTDENTRQLIRVMNLVTHSAMIVKSNHNRHNSISTNFSPGTMQNGRVGVGPSMAGGEEAVAALTNGQRLILKVLEAGYRKNLRKHHGNLFKQVLTVDENGNEFRTHAWKSHCSIKDFVYQCANKHEEWETWCDLTTSMRNPDFVTEYITNSTDDFELKSLNPNRHIFSFRNGVYDAFMDRMYSYQGGIPDHFVAAKFFDVDMPVDHPSGTSFRNIPTPVLDEILQYQGFGLDPHVPGKYSEDPEAPGFSVTDWIYVFMGRMIYAIGEFDTWQVLMFMKGKAGTGKSTLGKILSNLYNPVDVAVLSNNIEQKFGLSSIYEALIYICYEVKRDFKLDQGEMQSMISGEPISIAIKNKSAKSVSWESHGFFMGNEFPSWTNNSGSIGRRIVVALFDTVVKDGDPKLFDKLQDEMGNIIVKINRAYRECSAVYGGDDVWTVLPPYFHEQRERQLEASTSVISAYIVYLKYEDMGQTFILDPDGVAPASKFRTFAMDWISDTLGVKKFDWPKEKENLVQHKLYLGDNGNTIRGIRMSEDIQ